MRRRSFSRSGASLLRIQLVVVAQENRPLAALGNIGRLANDVGDRKAIFLRDRHVHARHQREVEYHVAFVARAEIFLDVFRPLVGFRKQHAVRIILVDHAANVFQDRVRLRQVLACGALAFDKIGDRVQPEPVDADVEPEAHGGDDGFEHARIVEIKVRLVCVESVPVIGIRFLVPCPVGLFRIEKNYLCSGVSPVVV